MFEFGHHVAGQFFWLTNFTVAPTGVTYAEEIPGDRDFESHQQLVAVRNHRVTLLLQERNRTPR